MRLTLSAMVSFTLVVVCSWGSALGQETRREIPFPDLPGYETLVCDFHMHTVFSDGTVWPTIRVEEAWRTGLDAIAITDHVEYQPHKNDIPTALNRPYEIALPAARKYGILLIRAAEITRDTPPGHFNALFLQDVERLNTPEFLDAIAEANKQGAFIIWNHQGWKGEEAGRWLDVHQTMYDNKWLHAMEVCNNQDYYPTAHKWALERNLTMVGCSDIHKPDLRTENSADDHRTLTLVFVKERSLEGLKEALFAGRTLIWFNDQLIGQSQWLEKMLEASVHVYEPHLIAGNRCLLRVHNYSPVPIQLAPPGRSEPEITLAPCATTLVQLPYDKEKGVPTLRYDVLNFIVAPGKCLSVEVELADLIRRSSTAEPAAIP